MTVLNGVGEQTEAATAHPLDPLSRGEIAAAVGILRRDRELTGTYRFASVVLHEPAKDAVRDWDGNGSIEREARVILLDRSDGMAYEGVVSLSAGEVRSWRDLPGMQPSIMLDEFVEVEEMLKRNPEFQAALAKRGVTDMELVMVDPWSNGNFGSEEDLSRRLTRALTWVRRFPGDNGYARPVEGLVPIVDLNTMELVRLEDYGVVPLAPEDGNYTPEHVGPMRTDLKPIEITQPEGTSFELDGNELRWQKWRLRVGFTPREGLVLHTVSYEDAGRERPVLYRASVCEMVVPYGDPRPTQYRKNAFDVGEYGIGALANSLELGCDCLGEIRYMDAHLVGTAGTPFTIKNAVCIHEEDYSLLWKHVDWRTGETEVRRSRRLVVSFVATVGNYEYGFYWYLYQDGTIEAEVKLSGILSTAGAEPGERPEWGTIVAPQLYAPIHQHFFSVRLDMSVDGEENSVYEVNAEAVPRGPANPHGNAFRAVSTLLRTDTEAKRDVNPQSARYWKVVNPNVRNGLGEPTAYKLVPGENCFPFADEDASVTKRANFITHHLWVTPYERAEAYPAGDFPNQHPGGAGLAEWTQSSRPIENTDVVLWY